MTLLALQAAAQVPRVVDLPTRPNVTQRYLWIAPEAFDASVILMVGGSGRLSLSEQGAMAAGNGNFLARSLALFLAQGLAVALVDAPSDRQSAPYLSGFRQTPEHATDLRAVIADVRTRTGKPVVMVGTSRGTQSAAAVAVASADAGGLDALVLTSSILTDPQSRAVPQMALETLRLPVLVVHHERDGCRLCLFSDLASLTAKIKAPNAVLIYKDGSSAGDPCEAMAYHGYNGIEAQVVADIATWIKANIPH